jgi:hypothetical protein
LPVRPIILLEKLATSKFHDPYDVIEDVTIFNNLIRWCFPKVVSHGVEVPTFVHLVMDLCAQSHDSQKETVVGVCKSGVFGKIKFA